MDNDTMPPPMVSIGFACLTCHELVRPGTLHTCWQGTPPERLGCCPLCGRAEGA